VRKRGHGIKRRELGARWVHPDSADDSTGGPGPKPGRSDTWKRQRPPHHHQTQPEERDDAKRANARARPGSAISEDSAADREVRATNGYSSML